MRCPIIAFCLLCLSALIIMPVMGYPLTLVAYWSCDETGGNVLPDLTGGNDGTIYGAALATGKISNALAFNGDDVVNVTDATELKPAHFTIEAWIFINETSGLADIVAKHQYGPDAGYELRLYNGLLQFVMAGSSGWQVLSASPLSLNTWHHVVATYNGSQMVIYVNGTKRAFMAASSVSHSDSKLQIGGHDSWTGFERGFHGYIDEVAIYSEALPADVILSHYLLGGEGHDYFFVVPEYPIGSLAAIIVFFSAFMLHLRRTKRTSLHLVN